MKLLRFAFFLSALSLVSIVLSVLLSHELETLAGISMPSHATANPSRTPLSDLAHAAAPATR
jgi:hypothetical protein